LNNLRRQYLIEGLRAYLALWVLVGHVLSASGYEEGQLQGFAWLLGANWAAVDVFVIISGFVIFLLLDKQVETNRAFICRRFFRLYPVYILLFGISIPVSILWGWNLQHLPFLSAAQVSSYSSELKNVWSHSQWNILWHLPMLHGAAPDSGWSKCTDTAFLGPAWSISLEWQFYLLAPITYYAAVSSRPLYRIGVCVFCLYLFWGRDFLPAGLFAGYSKHGAFLPFHVEYFFIGAASYFAYKKVTLNQADVVFPIAASLGIFLWRPDKLIPICLWIIFLGLLLEKPESYSRRLLSKFFENPVSQFLGRISYSIYLSHILVLIAVQYLLLKYASDFSQPLHFWMLLGATTGGTILISSTLYRLIELPGIRLGHKFASRFQKNCGDRKEQD
jgi:peptidoglycan/LPS O-acetylase OafA/YrhL